MIELNRAERSKLHLAILDSLDAGDDGGPRAAYAEAIAWAGTGGIADLANLLDMASAIDGHIYSEVYKSRHDFCEVDASELREEFGSPTVNLALKVAGISPRQRADKIIWTDRPAESTDATRKVRLPANLFEEWNS